MEAGDDELVPVQQDCLIQHADSRTYAIEEKDFHNMGVEKCYPILVCTGTDVTSYPKTIFLTDLQHSLLLSCLGVFDHTKEDKESDVILNHNHRDFSVDNSLKVPYKTVHNAYEAVQYVFKKEGIIS